MAAAPIAAGVSLASAGLSAYSSIESGKAQSAADTYKAEMLDQAAQYGDLKATQTNAQMTNNLNITLGHIDAVRAAAKTDPTSPTGAAVRDYAEQVGTEEKGTTVSNIMEQATTDEENAAYLRSASSDALLSGDLGAVSSLLKGSGGALAGLGGLGSAGAVAGGAKPGDV